LKKLAPAALSALAVTVFVAHVNVLALRLIELILRVEVIGSAAVAVAPTGECGYPTACVHYQRLLLPLRAHKEVYIEVLQVRTVTIKVRILQMHMQ
jgi:hypothetical protein